MFDAIVHHLNLDLFFVALVGHLVAESSAKLALHGIRQITYLMAVAMIPILMHVVMRHERPDKDSIKLPKLSALQKDPKRKRGVDGIGRQ